MSRQDRTDGDPAARTVDRIAELRLTLWSAATIALLSLINAAAKVLCLALVTLAVYGEIPWAGVLLAWAAAQGAQSLNLTPAGLGVVEAALGLALVATGIPGGAAVAIVLLYRTISLWLVLLAGGIVLLLIRRRRPT